MSKLIKTLLLLVTVSNALISHAQDTALAAELSPGTYFFLKQFGGERARFSADLHFLIASRDGKPIKEYSSRIAMIPGAFRHEFSASEIKTPRLTPDTIAVVKMMGGDKQAFILRVDRKLYYYVLPDANLHVVEPVPAKVIEKARQSRPPKKTYLGKDIINGYRCKKYRFIEKKPERIEGTVWIAPSLGGFPIRIESIQENERTTVTFQNVSTNTPAAWIFEIPTNSVQKANAKELSAAVRENWAQRLIDKEKQKAR